MSEPWNYDPVNWLGSYGVGRDGGRARGEEESGDRGWGGEGQGSVEGDGGERVSSKLQALLSDTFVQMNPIPRL